MNVSKNSIKSVKSLHQKKKRFQEKKYLVEGVKLIEEYLKSSPEQVSKIIINADYDLEIPAAIQNFEQLFYSTSQEFNDLSQQSTASGIIAVIDMQERPLIQGDHILYLDQINDPGNLGTIIRLADWYGLQQIIVSPNTVDWSNYKSIQSAMGSSARVGIHTMSFDALMAQFPNHALIGASMEGESVYTHAIPTPGVLIMGSESHGISEAIRGQLTAVCAIPSFGPTESLNVGVATAILLHEWHRP